MTNLVASSSSFSISLHWLKNTKNSRAGADSIQWKHGFPTWGALCLMQRCACGVKSTREGPGPEYREVSKRIEDCLHHLSGKCLKSLVTEINGFEVKNSSSSIPLSNHFTRLASTFPAVSFTKSNDCCHILAKTADWLTGFRLKNLPSLSTSFPSSSTRKCVKDLTLGEDALSVKLNRLCETSTAISLSKCTSLSPPTIRFYCGVSDEFVERSLLFRRICVIV